MQSMKFVVIATPDECHLIAKEHRHFPVIITGVGAINVIKALSGISRDAEIINYGYAGSTNLVIGETYKVGEVCLYHPNVTYCEPHMECDSHCAITCYTSCDFVLKSEITKSCVFDMELAYIVAMGFKKVTAYKTVSDNLNYEQYETSRQRKSC